MLRIFFFDEGETVFRVERQYIKAREAIVWIREILPRESPIDGVVTQPFKNQIFPMARKSKDIEAILALTLH